MQFGSSLFYGGNEARTVRIKPPESSGNDEKNSKEMNRTVHSALFYGYDMI